MEPRTIFLVGKPGSGKGDQGKLLAQTTGWKVITPGEQFRALSSENTPVGQKVKAVNDAGILQPYWLAEYLFLKNLFSLGADESVIFDGFARKVSEAEFIQEALAWIGRPFSVIHLIVSDEELRHRIALRKDIEGRADDNAIDERLREYREHTEPAIEKFRVSGNLIEIDGERAREPIAEDIRKALGV
ncbi:MAG: nucleoside monophosphate kinase [Candidatus Pacebacteria bacterium]|nr:nucleoside monophosphate kinase [Candidatus Paceibacterota bacterium]